MRELSALQLKAHLEECRLESDKPQPLLLDVRQPWEYDVCKIEDSVLIPMSKITTEVHSLDNERETVVICHHGIRTLQGSSIGQLHIHINISLIFFRNETTRNKRTDDHYGGCQDHQEYNRDCY